MTIVAVVESQTFTLFVAKLGIAHVVSVFCVGGSKELAMLYESYSTATFVMQYIFVLYR